MNRVKENNESREGLLESSSSSNHENDVRPLQVLNSQVKGKKNNFVKAMSVEPSGNSSGNSQVMMRKREGEKKKTLTTFWSNLFGTKIPENRNSVISIQSASYESVNTILSSNSFSFVSPKKYKGKGQKGKRLPVAELPAEDPTKQRKKVGTLTRIGIKMGLKSKYNLQSCESLQCLSQLEVEGASAMTHTGTLNNTFRRKKLAAPLPPATSSGSPDVSAVTTLPRPVIFPHSSKIVPVETRRAPRIVSDGDDQYLGNEEIFTSSSAEPKPGTSGTKNQMTPSQQTVSAEHELFGINVVRHKRSVSEGYSTPSSSPMTNRSNLHTPSSTYTKSKTHVRGKRRAPPPPNPFGDPDAPEETQSDKHETPAREDGQSSKKTESGINLVRQQEPVQVPINPFEVPEEQEPESQSASGDNLPHPSELETNVLISEPVSQSTSSVDNGKQQSHSQQQTFASSSNLRPAASEHPVEESEADDEVAQNLLNARYEESFKQDNNQDAQSSTSVILLSKRATPETNDDNMAKFRDKSGKASKSSKEALRFVSKDKSPGVKRSNVGDVCVGASFYSSFSENSQSKPSGASISPQPSRNEDTIADTPSEYASTYTFSSLSVSSTNSSCSSSSPGKLTPKPWYKRAAHAGPSHKKTKQLITPVPGMTKFSDIDREAARIVEENKRRSTELETHESARELITMFNAFNKSQRSPVPRETDSSSSDQAASVTLSSTSTNNPVAPATKPSTTNSEYKKTEALPATTHSANVASAPSSNQPAQGLATSATTAKQPNVPELPLKSTSAGPTKSAKEETSKKLAVVQPQSNHATKQSEPSRISAPAVAKTAHSLQSSANTESQRRGQQSDVTSRPHDSTPSSNNSCMPNGQDWSCPRCTLRNEHWRFTCEACYYKKYCGVQKPEVLGTPSSPTSDARVNATTAIPTGAIANGKALSNQDEKLGTPPCENFLSQVPSKEALSREEKLSGIKLTEDPSDDNLDITRLREARLAFFNKSIEKGIHKTSSKTQSKTNDLAVDNLLAPKESVKASGNFGHTAAKRLNVFSDNEDDSIDNLLQLQVFSKIPNVTSVKETTENGDHSSEQTSSHPFGTMPGAPDFADNCGSRTWNPFQGNRFKPMLESILESSPDMYLSLDNVYQNWNFEKGFPPHAMSRPKGNSSTSTEPVRKNKAVAKRQVIIGKDGKILPLPYSVPQTSNSQSSRFTKDLSSTSNSDSSEYDYENQSFANTRIDRSLEEKLAHRVHEVRFRSPFQERRLTKQEKKMTIEDYRKLGAIPKNYKPYTDEEPEFSDVSLQRKQFSDPKHQRVANHQSYLSETDSGSESCHSFFDTVAVTKLLKQLEHAIAKGDHDRAAALAHDLALLKVECVVSKGSTNPREITIFVYVEDRFMQQGPFEVEISQYMTVGDLKAKIQKDWSIPMPFQKWILGKRAADDDNELLITYNMCQDSLVYLYLVTPQFDAMPETDYTESFQSLSSPHDISPKPNTKKLRDNELKPGYGRGFKEVGMIPHSSTSNELSEGNFSSESSEKVTKRRQESKVASGKTMAVACTNTEFPASTIPLKSSIDMSSGSTRKANNDRGSGLTLNPPKSFKEKGTQSIVNDGRLAEPSKMVASVQIQASPEPRNFIRKILIRNGDSKEVQSQDKENTFSESVTKPINHTSDIAKNVADKVLSPGLVDRTSEFRHHVEIQPNGDPSRPAENKPLAKNNADITVMSHSNNENTTSKSQALKPELESKITTTMNSAAPVPTKRNKKKQAIAETENGGKLETITIRDTVNKMNGSCASQGQGLGKPEGIGQTPTPPVGPNNEEAEGKKLHHKVPSKVNRCDQGTQSSLLLVDEPPPLPKKGTASSRASQNHCDSVSEGTKPATLKHVEQSTSSNGNSNTTTSIPKPLPSVAVEEKEDNVQTFLKMMQKLEHVSGVQVNANEFFCSICLSQVKTKAGVAISTCGHQFCRKCLSRQAKASNGAATLRCPYRQAGNQCTLLIHNGDLQMMLQKSQE